MVAQLQREVQSSHCYTLEVFSKLLMVLPVEVIVASTKNDVKKLVMVAPLELKVGLEA